MELSSEEINQSNINYNDIDFVGSFIEFRKLIDYNYYSNYTPERQLLQDNIIYDIIDPYKTNYKNKNKWVIYLCGIYGSGKGHVLKSLKTPKEHVALRFLIKSNILDLNL